MGSCAAPSAKGGHNFITSTFLQQCRLRNTTTPLKVTINKVNEIVTAIHY